MSEGAAWFVVICIICVIIGLLWYRYDNERRKAEKTQQFLESLPKGKK